MSTAPHVLVVTADPDDPDPDLYDYAIECPGITDRCRAWQECTHPDAPPTRDRNDRWNTHGVEHRDIQGIWMVPTDRCYVQNHDGLPDAVAGRFTPGRHEVDFDIDTPDDGDIQIIAI